MLEKVRGITRQFDKLRVIKLMEADLNMILRFLSGKRLNHLSEDKQTILRLQWRSRPNRSSMDAILMKRLTYDIIHIL